MKLFSKRSKNEEEALKEMGEDQKINEGIEIHSMPEKYRKEHVKVSRAKMTGVIILSAGVVALLAMAVVMYYVLFAGGGQQEEVVIDQNTKVEENFSNNNNQQTVLDINGQNAENASVDFIQENLEENMDASSQEEVVYQEEYVSLTAVSGIDNDNDGLTDSEEQLLGTDLSKIDTDGDGYDDLTELNNFYNPAGAGQLIENLSIRKIENNIYNYTVYYPAEWTKKASDNDESVIFMSADNQFVQIIVQPNYSGQTIDDWYREQFNLTQIETDRFILIENWTGLRSPDGLTIYFNDENQKNIFALTYNIGSSNTVEYKNIFDMMVKSFKFID